VDHGLSGLVEDVVTSGGQVIESTRHLREFGAAVDNAVCVIDRESGAQEAIAAEGVVLSPLFTMSQLDKASGTERTSYC